MISTHINVQADLEKRIAQHYADRKGGHAPKRVKTDHSMTSLTGQVILISLRVTVES
ncbi:hypothetical protein [Deinococcus hopiensis]|uniref:Uncharacterized protein n=1 Tax=Deinococcus hopiensis KR-140 TaxID=695939 RepID=A0A1W1UAV3_9DEIO|nr:hypothetical protein [Deinococcus hopiensis]SMB78215.1 hypothetical protein SAMN00790413_06555 [Deinococcus hopiensis KR-140]